MILALIIQQPKIFKPPKWEVYEMHYQSAGYTHLFAAAKTVNRFFARYRFARAFKGLELEGYSDETTSGYNALTKVTLHWTAFEQLCRAIKITDMRMIGQRHSYDECIKSIREADPQNIFFRSVKFHITTPDQKIQLDAFINNGTCSSLTLAKSIRHIFLHGPLTPNVNGCSPHAVSAICDALCKSLVEIMDIEFANTASDLEELLTPPS